MSKLTELLIEAVKKYPCMYDPRDIDYKQLVKKADAWRNIASDVGYDRATLKVKWKNLRDCYIRYKRSITRNSTSQAVSKYKKWPWAARMKFLDSTLAGTRTSKAEAEGLSSSATARLQYPIESVLKHTASAELRDADTSPETKLRNSLDSRATSSLRIHRNTKDCAEKIIDYLKTQREQAPLDLVDHLFLSYSNTFKRFSLRKQAHLKMQLATLFATSELEEIEAKHGSQGGSLSLICARNGFGGSDSSLPATDAAIRDSSPGLGALGEGVHKYEEMEETDET